MEAPPLDLGFSPCPNDTFVFHALTHGLVAPESSWNVRLEDVETLNGLAQDLALDVAKVSYHAFATIADAWWMLPAGGALGRGVGPLIVTRDPLKDVRGRTVATPGGRTTANLLLRLWAPAGTRTVPMRYDRIMPAVASGDVDAGLIIHESRFTYGRYGLRRHLDLGAWWEEVSGAPIPLGGIAVRRDLAPEQAGRVAEAVAASVRHARSHPDASRSYVAEHAQEMEPDVRERHIELYVNEFTDDVGEEGRRAVRTLFRYAAERGVLAPVREDAFLPVAGDTGDVRAPGSAGVEG